MYLSKNCILKALSVLSKAEPVVNNNNFSAIQYFLATDQFYKINKAPCNSRNKEHKNSFYKFVNIVVSLDDGNYFKSFKEIYKGNKTINGTVSSNFFNGSAVESSNNTSGQKFDYPKQYPLIYALDGKVYKENSYYNNFSDYYLSTNEEKLALAIWLLRKNRKFENLTIDEFRDLLDETYSSLMVNTLIPKKIEDWDDIIKGIMVECVDEVAVIKKEDIVGTKHLLITPQIFYGAPGTGKTRHIQKEIYDKFVEKNRVFTTFHQSYSYEDFVEGLKPILDDSSEDVKYRIEKGVFYKACEKAA